MAQGSYDVDLERNPANFQPLTPLSFLERAASVFPDHIAIIHGPRKWTMPTSTPAPVPKTSTGKIQKFRLRELAKTV